jgi:hypothetical protein
MTYEIDGDPYEYCMLDIRTEISPAFGEPTDNILVYKGDIRSGFEFVEVVGTIELYVIDLYRGIDKGWPPWEVVDSFDSGLAKFCVLFDRDESTFHPKVLRLTKVEMSGLLILNRIEIEEKFRGRALGLQAIQLVCDRFQNWCQVAALKAFPLQWEGKVEGQKDKEGLLRDQAKLVRHYRRAGFKSFNRDGLMVRSL